MSKNWKRTEREAGALIGGTRYPASMGGPIDVESSWCVGQVKHVARMSLAEIEREVLEIDRQGQQKHKIGVLIVRRRGGQGVCTPRMVMMTEGMFRAMSGALPGDRAEDTRAGTCDSE